MASSHPLSLDERLALLDRAQALALRDAALQEREEVIQQLLNDCQQQGLDVPRASVEQAVTDFLAQPEDHWPTAAERRTQVFIKIATVIGLSLVGLAVLRVVIPLFGRLLAPLI